MMHTIKTYTIIWLTWYAVNVEIDSSKALPGIDIIWLPDTAIKESKDRIRSSFRAIDAALPNRRFIINLAPSNIRKVGTSYDVALFVSLMTQIYQHITHIELLQQALFFWELGLDGSVKRINWLLPMVINAYKAGHTHFVVPQANFDELKYIANITVYTISHVSQLMWRFTQWQNPVCEVSLHSLADYIVQPRDQFGDIKWQYVAKRALSVAAAGMHNVLMIWAPGSGKTMLAKATQSILPPLSPSEVIDVSQLYSLVGKLNSDNPLIFQRPFRTVHHTASKVSIVWWWQSLHPWEISLAHRGILFLDELPEFARDTLDVLRQPIEDKVITISRASWTVQYPSDFMLIAAMNPCTCGYYKDPVKPCSCSLQSVKKYQSRISWPLLDRIDMILEIPRESMDVLRQKGDESVLHTQVMTARDMQQRRFWGTKTSNSQLTSRDIDTLQISTDGEQLLRVAAQKFTLSPRVIHRIIKVSRTIADLDASDHIQTQHIAESLQYRSRAFFA